MRFKSSEHDSAPTEDVRAQRTPNDVPCIQSRLGEDRRAETLFRTKVRDIVAIG